MLIPYRQQLNKGHLPMLLLMDGHRTHSIESTLEIFRQNNIFVEFFPPHTSHVIQPLDVSLFNAYKAAWRRSGTESVLDSVPTQGVSAATSNRTRMMAKSLIAHERVFLKRKIKSAFKKTGLYPISFDQFLANAGGIRNVPPQRHAAALQAVENELQAFKASVAGKRRRDVSNAMFIATVPEANA